MKKLFLLLGLCLQLGACTPSHLAIFPDLDDPNLVNEKIPVKFLQEDIDAFLVGALERHPTLSDNQAQLRLVEYAKQLKAEIKTPMTRVEFFQIIARLNHRFKDGHSMLIWPYPEWQKIRDEKLGAFPFDVVITTENQLLLGATYKHQDIELRAGTVVTSINGVDSSHIIEELQQYAGGETKHLRKQAVARSFPMYLWVIYGYLKDFTLELQTESVTQSLAISTTQDWQSSAESTVDFADYRLSILEDNVALLDIDSFDTDIGDFEDFIDLSFAQLKQKNVQALIIDIRSNTGGNTDTVSYLTSYIASEPFRLGSHLTEKLNSDNRGLFGYKGEKGDIIAQEWDDWVSPIEAAKRFDGPVYLLIDALSYSASIVLATTLQDFDFATLIGEETGGKANQTAQGNLFNLPHSQLRAYITTRMLVRPSGEINGRGVIPTYEVSVTAESLKAGKDPALDKVLSLVTQ